MNSVLHVQTSRLAEAHLDARSAAVATLLFFWPPSRTRKIISRQKILQVMQNATHFDVRGRDENHRHD